MSERPTGWARLGSALHARYALPDYATGLAFVAAAGTAAQEADHHPETRLSYGHVDLRLSSHDVGRITARDERMAHRLAALAAEHGLTPCVPETTLVEIALDTPDPAAIAPFWSAVLTGRPDAVRGREIIDPTLQTPLLWLQETDPHAEPRQRFHLDVWVAPEAARARIEAAVAAGGVVVDDARAPSFVVLADADGNKACVCTEKGRV